MARDNALELLQNSEKRVQELVDQNSRLSQRIESQSQDIEHLEEVVRTLNLLKILSTTGIMRDLDLGSDPEVKELLRRVILNQLSHSIFE